MVKIENNNEYKIGDKVWWFDSKRWLKWGIIFGLIASDGAVVDRVLIRVNGKKEVWEEVKHCDCWPSEKECVAADRRIDEIQMAEYKESIKDVKDLVIFLLKYGFDDDGVNWRAQITAEDCAEELLGIKMED